MSMRSTLYSEEDREFQAKRPKTYFPITTQGKIALSEWREQHVRIIARERPSNRDPSKPLSLPPPGEMTEVEELLKLRKTSNASKSVRGYDKKKPLTTQEKIAAAKALERARGGEYGKDWRPMRGVKVPGSTTQARLLGNQQHRFNTQRQDGPGVLFRKTKRSESWTRTHPTDTYYERHGIFKLMEVPIETRNRIWKLVVVKESAFIWPESVVEQEQPDLAMTCRTIREEVLPIFYGANTFGVVISPTVINPQSGKHGNEVAQMSGVAVVHKWTKVLEDERNENGKWLHHIQHWAFCYTDRKIRNHEADIGGSAQGQSFVVLMSFNSWATGLMYKPPEIHQEAACVLSGWEECGACSPARTPTKINDLVRHAQRLAWKNRARRADLILTLAQQLQGQRVSLFKARCHRDGEGSENSSVRGSSHMM